MTANKNKNHFQVFSGISNVFLISSADGYVLIDTGTQSNYIKLQARLKEIGADTIKYLILTHAHFDHAANAKKIQKNYKAKIVCGEKALPYLRGGFNENTKGNSIYAKMILAAGNKLPKITNFEPVNPDISLKSGRHNLCSDLRIISTPGHTDGSISIIFNDRLAFVGDVLFGLFKKTIRPPFILNKNEIIKSWHHLLAEKCAAYYPSHGKLIDYKRLEKSISKEFSKDKNACFAE